MRVSIYFIFILCFSFAQVASAAPEKIKVKEPLTTKLKSILDESETLHRVLVSRDSETLKSQIRSLLSSVEGALSFAYLAGDNTVHLNKILEAARRRLREAQDANENQNEKALFFIKESYRQIIQLAKLYELDRRYRVFYCLKDEDRSAWLQKDRQPLNPFDPDGRLKNCGTPIP